MGQVGWIKVNTNIFSNRKIKILLKEREGDTYFRIWIQILTIAGECNRDGGLYISDNTPFKIKDFTNIIGKSSKTITKILQKFPSQCPLAGRPVKSCRLVMQDPAAFLIGKDPLISAVQRADRRIRDHLSESLHHPRLK